MSSNECLRDRSASVATESFDVSSKKKKSFHPLRSLKRFFGHAGSSQQRPNNGSEGYNSNSRENSVLLKARSTTDVIVAGKDTVLDENSDAFQRSNKQISLSADSIFSSERMCEQSIPVSAISSETLLHSDHSDLNVQSKDDDEGLPQSPFVVATTSHVFFENELKQQSEEKWPSFDSGHSLLSVDSNENEVEEDFFKEKWVVNSKLSLSGTENDVPTAEKSVQEDFDLNLVQRHSSLISTAAIHRVAVRPRGKRVSSIHQQKLVGASMMSPISPISLPLVKEISSGTEDEFCDLPKSSGKVDAVAEKTVPLNSPQREEPDLLQKAVIGLGSEKPISTQCFEEEGGKGSLPGTSDACNTQRVVAKKVIGKPESNSAEKVGEKEGGALSVNQSPRASQTEDTEQQTHPETVGESAKVIKSVPDEASAEQPSTKQAPVSPPAVVIRQKPPRAVAPTAKEIREITARRQTLAFVGEPGSSTEKPILKRSSVIIEDRPSLAADAVNTELAQMFSKFQQKKQAQGETSSLRDADPCSDKTAGGSTVQVGFSSKEAVQGGGKGQEAHVTAAPREVKYVARAMEPSFQRTGSTGIGSKIGGSTVEKQKQEAMGFGEQKKALDSSPNKYGGGGRAAGGGGDILAGANRSTCPTEQENSKSGKDVEKKAEEVINNERAKNVEKETKTDISQRLLIRGISNKTDDAKVSGNSSPVIEEGKTRGMKKAYSIAYKNNSASMEKLNSAGKSRSQSQSDPLDAEADAPKEMIAAEGVRRGSFAYTNPKTYLAHTSDISKKTVIGANAEVKKDARYMYKTPTPPSVVTIRPSSQSGKIVPSGSGTSSSESDTVPSVVPTLSSGAGSTTSPVTSAPFGVASGSTSVSTRVVKASEVSGATPKSKKVPHTGTTKAVTDASLLSETKRPTLQKENSGESALAGGEPSQKASPVVRAAGGQQKTVPKKTVQDGESTVEWLGVALQKTKAWTEGKVNALEKMSCK